jgi:hypothetical protein
MRVDKSAPYIHRGKVSEERSKTPKWVWEPPGRGFHTQDHCFLGFPSSWLGAAGVLGRLLRPGRLTGGGHFRSLGGFRDRLGRFLRSRVWSGCLNNKPPLHNVVPLLAHVHLLGSGPGQL